jgi:alpha-L-rhamnosidase
MMDTWNSARMQQARQLNFDPSYKRPLEELAFRAMSSKHDPNDQSNNYILDGSSAGRETGIWNSMLALTEMHGQIMQLNHDMLHNTSPEFEVRARLEVISTGLSTWLDDLPEHLRDTPENWESHVKIGLGREFAVHQLVYHHQCQLLYFQFLGRGAGSTNESIDLESRNYMERCKTHAARLSEVMWKTNSVPEMQCLWSPVNGHLLVVASSIHLHTLLFDSNAKKLTNAKILLEQNFVMLHQFQNYWPLLWTSSMERLQAFHRACQSISTFEIFNMDRWMDHFLRCYDSQVPERFEIVEGGQTSAVADNAVELWQELSDGISQDTAHYAVNTYF